MSVSGPPQTRIQSGSVVALCGGIGGAKLALGLAHIIPDTRLLIAVNVGDDFEHLGLHISPDIDTVTYTLAGIANPETGWGRAAETWQFMAALTELGGEAWFRLGDRDLAVNVERTQRLGAGQTLSAITDDFRDALGISARVLPASDDAVRTVVETEIGRLAFQNYFVEHKCAPAVEAISYVGAETARVQPILAAALRQPDLRAVIICPSNPYLSVDPILAICGVRDLLRSTPAPVVAVSPVVGGAAVKGPMGKIMGELGFGVSHATIAAHYADIIDGLVTDGHDDGIRPIVAVTVANTLMNSLDEKVALARLVLSFADDLKAGNARLGSRVG